MTDEVDDALTLWTLVEREAERDPDRVVLADDRGRSLTAAGLRDAAERAAAGLAGHVGATVSWQLPTVLEAPVLMVALSRAGVTQNPVIPVLRHHEVGAILGEVRPDTVVVPSTWRGFEHAAMVRGLGYDVVELDLEATPGPGLCLPEAEPALLGPAAPAGGAWIYYTSGTTSAPKGVRHHDRSLLASATGLFTVGPFGPGDVYPIAWPIAHIGGIGMLVMALRGGVRLVLFDTWDPAETPERMAAHDPTVLGSAQPFFRAYLDDARSHGESRFDALRFFTAGGAPTPPEIADELTATFGTGVVASYGLTEFPIATVAHTDDDPEVLRTSVGRPGPGVSVRIVDGEVRLRGPQCFAGYVDPDADAAAFDADGWFRTGDLGERDPDGVLRITGRLKEVIVRNAENISALEVEDVLLRHPRIVDAAVVGVPDPRTGERVVAAVVTDDGAPLGVAEVAGHCAAAGLARFKFPEAVETRDVLPRNAMGKLRKDSIRDDLTDLHG